MKRWPVPSGIEGANFSFTGPIADEGLEKLAAARDGFELGISAGAGGEARIEKDPSD